MVVVVGIVVVVVVVIVVLSQLPYFHGTFVDPRTCHKNMAVLLDERQRRRVPSVRRIAVTNWGRYLSLGAAACARTMWSSDRVKAGQTSKPSRGAPSWVSGPVNIHICEKLHKRSGEEGERDKERRGGKGAGCWWGPTRRPTALKMYRWK